MLKEEAREEGSFVLLPTFPSLPEAIAVSNVVQKALEGRDSPRNE